MTGQKLFIMPQCDLTITRIDLVTNSNTAVLIKKTKVLSFTSLYHNSNLVLCEVVESPKNFWSQFDKDKCFYSATLYNWYLQSVGLLLGKSTLMID